MKIEEFETKYSIEDIVYLIYDNKIEKAVITEVDINISENCSITNNIKKFFGTHKRTIDIRYNINIIRDGKFYCAPRGYFCDENLAISKEELLQMPEYNK